LNSEKVQVALRDLRDLLFPGRLFPRLAPR
jgi:hypothetical protein